MYIVVYLIIGIVSILFITFTIISIMNLLEEILRLELEITALSKDDLSIDYDAVHHLIREVIKKFEHD